MSQVTRTQQLRAICTALKVLERAVLSIAKDELTPEDYQTMAQEFVQRMRSRSVRKCLQCHKEFQGRGLKFCSGMCAANSKRKPTRTRTCPQCQRTFETRHRQKYCSTCKENLKSTRPPKPCKVCNTIFQPSQRAQKFCTKMCKQQWFNLNKATDAGRKELLRTVGKCEHCGEAERRSLHAHHINGRTMTDLMLLCANCHYKYHHIMGKSVFAETRSREDVLQVLRTGDAVKELQAHA